jgi:hypothetical protein
MVYPISQIPLVKSTWAMGDGRRSIYNALTRNLFTGTPSLFGGTPSRANELVVRPLDLSPIRLTQSASEARGRNGFSRWCMTQTGPTRPRPRPDSPGVSNSPLIPKATNTETVILAVAVSACSRAAIIEATDPCVEIISLRRCPPAAEVANIVEAPIVVAVATGQT